MIPLPLLVLCAALVHAEDADWRKSLDSMRQQATKTVAAEGSQLGGKLSQDDIARGLKQALDSGVRKAVAALGAEDGFLKAADVHIPIPEKLRAMERLARKVGMGRKADEFETSLNRAAESAVLEAAPVFASALKKMTLADARGILNGSEDAATRFFDRTCREALGVKFRPKVKAATRRVGVTRAYESLRQSAGPLLQLSGETAPDLDEYVTQKALDALFLRIAAEEKAIRKDPAARVTALLKKVFGS
jgi:hypothetical protein